MRKLKNPIILLDGEHFRIDYEKRAYANNRVEIIHILHKKTGRVDEFYSSNYAFQSETKF